MLRAEASLVLHGAKAVAGHTATYSGLYPHVRPALVNGAAGSVVVAPRGQPFSVMAFNVANGKITQIDALVDPERLATLGFASPADARPPVILARPTNVQPGRLCQALKRPRVSYGYAHRLPRSHVLAALATGYAAFAELRRC